MPTRRGLLLGGAGVMTAGAVAAAGYGVEQGTLPGRPFLQAHLGLNGRPGKIPDVTPGPVLEDSFTSAAMNGAETGWALMLPPGKHDIATLPLVVALHWYGADHTTLIGSALGLPQYLAAHVQNGGTPFAVVAADGGATYWHPHGGVDAGTMITNELLVLVQQKGIDTSRRIGLLGWSMGGYGVLRLAGLLGAAHVAAACATSPALWTDSGDAPSHAFSDAAEYDKYSVLGHQADLAGLSVRVDCGTGDPFYRAVQGYVGGFSARVDVVSHFDPGGHDPGYWRRMLPSELDSLGRALRPVLIST